MARVLVMGAGAVGGYYGACLARAGHDVKFVARGRNLDALRTSGLRISGAMGSFEIPGAQAMDEPRDAGEIDLALLCVKNYDLVDAANALRGVGDVTLTMQNGVEAPYVVREIVGDVVLAGSTGIVADLAEPGHVHLVSSYAWMRLGEPEPVGITARVSRVATWLDVEGIEAIPVADSRIALWEKMALMCAMAGLTSLHQRPIGELLGDPDLRATFEAIVRECEDVARAQGVGLADDFVDQRMRYADRIEPSSMSSMSRDLTRGRRIELETFNGAMVRLGSELGVSVPENRAVYDSLALMSAERDTAERDTVDT